MSDELRPCPKCGSDFVHDHFHHLQWTKTPPTEKELGKWFVAKRRRNDGTEEIFTGRLQISKSFGCARDRILRLNASSHCGVHRTERIEFLVIDGYEFLGPLPE